MGGDRSPVFPAGPINFPSFARCPNAPATLPRVQIIRSALLSLSNTNHYTNFSSVLIQSMVRNSYRAHFPTPTHPRPKHLHLAPCQCPSLYSHHCGVSVLDWIVWKLVVCIITFGTFGTYSGCSLRYAPFILLYFLSSGSHAVSFPLQCTCIAWAESSNLVPNITWKQHLDL